MDSHMLSPSLGTPMTPSGYSSVSSSTSAYSGRMSTGLRRFGEKLRLWSHKPTSAEDVYHSMRQTFKTYEKFNLETQKLLETLREWSLTVPNPALQTLIRDTTLAFKDVWDPSKNSEMRMTFDTILQGLQKLQHDEAVSQLMQRQAQASKRAMHKAIYQRCDDDYIDQHQRQWELLRDRADAEEVQYAATTNMVMRQTMRRLLQMLSESQHALRDGCNVGFKADEAFSEVVRLDEANLISPPSSDIGSDMHGLNDTSHSKEYSAYNPNHRHPNHPQNQTSPLMAGEKTQSLNTDNFPRAYEGFDVWKPQN